VSEQGKMMRDTPKEGDLHTEAGLFLVMHEALAAEREWRARLERKNAELSDQVMRWFKAASPYATPGSLEEGLKDVERFRILSEYVAAIIWKKDSDLPPLGHLKSGFSIDDLRAWCDGAKK
jgi:hypothetical protein